MLYRLFEWGAIKLSWLTTSIKYLEPVLWEKEQAKPASDLDLLVLRPASPPC